MDSDKYNRDIPMYCPTCGGTEFSQEETDEDEEEGIVQCITCEKEISKEDLIEENWENIEEHKKEIEEEVTKDMSKELENMLKKTFGGNKNFRLK